MLGEDSQRNDTQIICPHKNVYVSNTHSWDINRVMLPILTLCLGYMHVWRMGVCPLQFVGGRVFMMLSTQYKMGGIGWAVMLVGVAVGQRCDIIQEGVVSDFQEE